MESIDLVASFFSDQSSLNSVSTEVDELYADRVIEEDQAQDKDDHTKVVLSSFLRFLPIEGKATLVEFIANNGDKHETLYALY
ncbi:hypothetical protein AJ80_03082 [Polytolypa hystricis UAMH7299]|uniref:Uncharacterized protein n=1 Tax=Polytolypa hystricis (strain UAMH7299) TaxID=1447883 RepID=A0A2B7YKQ5_POLH7|nr:hypothetical protein AJ80_03082 [Polytolypa hystricis UAMH7299]